MITESYTNFTFLDDNTIGHLIRKVLYTYPLFYVFNKQWGFKLKGRPKWGTVFDQEKGDCVVKQIKQHHNNTNEDKVRTSWAKLQFNSPIEFWWRLVIVSRTLKEIGEWWFNKWNFDIRKSLHWLLYIIDIVWFVEHKIVAQVQAQSNFTKINIEI